MRYIRSQESLRRETLEVLRLADSPIAFDQHDSDWARLLERIAKTKPEVLLLDMSAVPVELSSAIRQIRCHVPRIKIASAKGEGGQTGRGAPLSGFFISTDIPSAASARSQPRTNSVDWPGRVGHWGAMSRRRVLPRKSGFLKHHALSIAAIGVLLLWIV
ncbi:MAG: hypothetical protein ACR2IV_17480, partial [Bryobacteraceae bacterium]